MIESGQPDSWRDLQNGVARILRECGFDSKTEVLVTTVRGDVEVDVVATDACTQPPVKIAIECKKWGRRVPKTVVHSFRTVVADAGFNTGLIVANGGFQRGAVGAADCSNVLLLDWNDFEAMFEQRWLLTYMAPTLRERIDPLIEYTEPINSRIFRKADALSEDRQNRFIELRQQHFDLAFCLWPLMRDMPGFTEDPIVPSLPIRDALDNPSLQSLMVNLPPRVLDATALRPLMDALLEAFDAAVMEFDQVFGERA